MSYEIIMAASLKMLSRRRLTIREITQRLDKKFPDEEATISSVIQRLREIDYLNDYSYVQAYARERLEFRLRGIALIKMELRRKGIAKDIIENAIREMLAEDVKSLENSEKENSENHSGSLDEITAAKKLAEKYMRRSAYKRAKNQRFRLAGFLRGRGFAGKTIAAVFDLQS